MSKISKELIENYRKIVLPFVSNQLYKANFEGRGETDKTEFEQDFNEILDLAISALERAQGDCENCDFRKFTEKFVDGVVEVMNKNGITSIEQLSEILKGGAE